jgi:hypothetical protein
VERLQRVGPLADAAEYDRLAGHRADRQRRTPAGVPVELGEDDAVVADILVEALGHRDGVLPRHSVHDQEDVMRLDLAPQDLQLLDHGLVDVEAPGRIEEDRIPSVLRRLLDRLACDVDGLLPLRAVNGQPQLLAEDAELLDGRGSVDVGRDQEGPEALVLEVPAQLGDARRLAGALEAQDHDDRRRPGRHGQPVRGAAEQLDQLAVDDLHHLLARGEALENLVPHRLLADALDEGADDLEVDVGLEEGDAHLAERLLNVLLRQAAGAPEAVENRLETLRQGFEHWILSESRGGIAKST